MSQQAFRMIRISPVGRKVKYYPEIYCLICRGHLNRNCPTCLGSQNTCLVRKNSADVNCHNHCLERTLSASEPKPKTQNRNTVASDSESSDNSDSE